MDPSKIIPENQRLSQSLVARITTSFDDANIENVLWGDCLLIIYRVPSGLDDISYVVPDTKITEAYSILMNMGFRECTTYRDCRTFANPGFAVIPSAHAHIDGIRFIGLYKQSETLWSMPSLKPGVYENNSKPDIISANDPSLPGRRPGRGRGAYSETSHPVHIISAPRLTEAYILLTLRDFGQSLGFFWRTMLTYLVEFLFRDGILDTRDLKPHHKRFFERFADPGDMTMVKIFEDLRSESMASNET